MRASGRKSWGSGGGLITWLTKSKPLPLLFGGGEKY